MCLYARFITMSHYTQTRTLTHTHSPCRFLVDGRFVDSLNCLLSGWFFSLSPLFGTTLIPHEVWPGWTCSSSFFPSVFLSQLSIPNSFLVLSLLGYVIDNGVGVKWSRSLSWRKRKGPENAWNKRAKRETRNPKKSFQNKLCKWHHI